MALILHLVLVSFLHYFSILSASAFTPSVDPDRDSLIAQGKAQYDIVRLESRMPRYGTCWKESIARLEAGCKHLDDEIQSRLALKFANCFLAKSGLRTYPCAEDQSIAECLEGVDPNGFTTYSNFFTHTQNMCYFLQAQVWQEETDQTVKDLSQNSKKVSKALESSHRLQEIILEGQEKTLEYNQQLIENSSYLSKAIQLSKENVRDMIDEFRLSTNEQKTLIFEVFDRLTRLQNLVLSEVNWLYTVVFYGACMLVIYIVTATKRSADARLSLFVILTLNLAAERFMCWYTLPTDGEKIPYELQETIYERVWLIREITIGISAIVFAVYIVRFKDYNLINNSLLLEIKKQNLELKRSMESFQVVKKQNYYGGIDSVDSNETQHLSSHVLKLLNEDTGFHGDEEADEEDNFSDDSDSFNSTRTDVSYNPSHSGELSDSVFNTALNSRENSGSSTPTNKVLDDFGDADVAGGLDITSSSALQPLLFTPTRRRGRPSGSRSRSTTPLPERDPYNLRSRKSTSQHNSILESESPEAFAKVVKHALGISKRNTSKWQKAVISLENNYSSDEL